MAVDIRDCGVEDMMNEKREKGEGEKVGGRKNASSVLPSSSASLSM